MQEIDGQKKELTGTFEDRLPHVTWHFFGVGNNYGQNFVGVSVEEVFNFSEVTLDFSTIEETLGR